MKRHKSWSRERISGGRGFTFLAGRKLELQTTFTKTSFQLKWWWWNLDVKISIQTPARSIKVNFVSCLYCVSLFHRLSRFPVSCSEWACFQFTCKPQSYCSRWNCLKVFELSFKVSTGYCYASPTCIEQTRARRQRVDYNNCLSPSNMYVRVCTRGCLREHRHCLLDNRKSHWGGVKRLYKQAG